MAPKSQSIGELVPVDDLIIHPDNPRRGDVRLIAESIEINGFYGSLVVQRSTRHVLVGNHRLQAARLLGMTSVPVVWSDVDDATARRILLADNRVSDLATYDDQVLVKLLAELAAEDTLGGTGWTPDDVGDILAILEREAPPTMLEMEKVAADMREKGSAKPRLVIDTTVEVVERFKALAGDNDEDKLVALLELFANLRNAVARSPYVENEPVMEALQAANALFGIVEIEEGAGA